MNNDKPLPQAIEAERAIIATCLCYPDTILNVMSIIKSDMFYDAKNRILYEAILETTKKGTGDIVSITDYLRKNKQLDDIGGVIELSQRTKGVITDAYVENYAYLIKEKYILRQYIFLSDKLSSMSYEEDLDDVVNFAEGELFNISNFTQKKEPLALSRLIDEYLIEIEKIQNKEKKLSGVASSYTQIDRITGGWEPENLIIIAGRPSMGKTAMALSLAKGAAENKFPVGFFSLEMSRRELAGRYLSGLSGKSNIELRSGNINLDDLSNKSNSLALLPIYIDDTPAINIFELRSKVKKLIIRNSIKLVIVDYLQLMHAEGGSREQEVSAISRGLKAMAKDLNIPVIALAQLNREVESRVDKKPRLSDLRESGAIEQDADMVCFIYRPFHYGIYDVNINNNSYDTKGLIVFDIAKNRNGALYTAPLYHNESLTIIKDEKDNQTQMGSSSDPF